MEKQVENLKKEGGARKGSRRPPSQFFRAMKYTSLILFTSAIVGFLSPKTSSAQEKEKPSVQQVLQDTLPFSMQLEGGMLSVIRDGGIEKVSILDSAYKYSGSLDADASMGGLIMPVITSTMPKLGTGAFLVFGNWAMAVFPDAPDGFRLRFVSAPGGKPFFSGKDSYAVFKDGTLLLLNPSGVAGFRYNFRFSNHFASFFWGVSDLVSPTVTALDSAGIDAVEVRDPDEKAMGPGVRLVITSGEKEQKNGELRSGLYYEVKLDTLKAEKKPGE